MFFCGQADSRANEKHTRKSLTLNSSHKIMLLAPAALPLAVGRPRAATRACISRPRAPVPSRCAPTRRAVVFARAEAVGTSTLPASLPALDGECGVYPARPAQQRASPRLPLHTH